jgi:hypothetical protein
MRQKFLVVLALGALAGCGDNGTNPGNDMAVADLSSAQLTCANYCALMAMNCKGDEATDGGLSQFPNAASCMHECMQMPVGTAADKTGDSLGCRTYHATLAATDPITHCPHAGSSGGGVCGDRCTVFCARALAVCTTANNVTTPYFKSLADCTNQCGKTPFKLDPTLPELTQTGATLNCAFYHMSEAYGDPPNTANDHCGDFDPTNAGRGCQ